MTSITRRLVTQLALLGLILGGQAGYAHASAFSVSPTRLVLAPGSTSAVLTLSNNSAHAVRFQLSAFAWDQTEDGRMQLAATKDIVFYPPLLTIDPGQSRRIRIGAVTPFAAIEKTYRLFVEELPQADEPVPAEGIHVRTKMGVPIFLRGPKPTTHTQVESLQLGDEAVSFHVGNSGTAHVVLQRVEIRGLAAGGEQVFTRSIDGWYLLAGHRRRFEVPVSKADCARVTTIAVVAESDGGAANRRLDVPAPLCGVQ